MKMERGRISKKPQRVVQYQTSGTMAQRMASSWAREEDT